LSELEKSDSEISELEEINSELEKILLSMDEELADVSVLELQELSSLGSELDGL
jgi:hypothetical protein